MTGTDGIDAILAKDHLDALVCPTMPPAWKIDAANGDQIGGGGVGSRPSQVIRTLQCPRAW